MVCLQHSWTMGQMEPNSIQNYSGQPRGSLLMLVCILWLRIQYPWTLISSVLDGPSSMPGCTTVCSIFSASVQMGLHQQHVCLTLFSCLARSFHNNLYFPYPVRCGHENCFSKRRGSLFACPRNNFFSEQGVIEFDVWETLDVTEQMWENRQQLGRPMQSLPAAARRVKQWVKKQSTKATFVSLYLSKLPSFFLHHQIEQVIACWFFIVSLLS